MRILYIMTTLAEYNTGQRSTKRGSDRLQETLIPVLTEGVKSMISAGYDVDVFLICHFTMREERLKLVRDRLPQSVGLQVWDDATPLGYIVERNNNKTTHVTRGLARQHRFVIKDKLLDYDFFVAFEDDMLITGQHVRQYLEVTEELQRLRDAAPDEISSQKNMARYKIEQMYDGPLSKHQLKRMIPGFMRVEVLLDEAKYGTQTKFGPIPLDFNFEGKEESIDSGPCCHVADETTNDHIPLAPSADKLFMWETGIEALGVREMPAHSSLGWVMLQRGPNPSKLEKNQIVGDFWAGRDNVLSKRPGVTDPKYINNQGGWMATRQQIWEWHNEVCPGGFLPPFDPGDFNFDGLDARNVEYWSGGISLFTARHACNLQRIVVLDPAGFSRQLIYHTANNKQKQLQHRKETFTKAETMWGQLNSVSKRAQKSRRQANAR